MTEPRNPFETVDEREFVDEEEEQQDEQMCSECGIYPVDGPGDLCVGCYAYREHVQVF